MAGIPGADVASHSLRRTGLCRLMSAKPVPMPWPLAKKFGRWESDCALRYFSHQISKLILNLSCASCSGLRKPELLRFKFVGI